jgi:hypothetical protein
MSTKSKFSVILILLISSFVNNLFSQTPDWKVIWDRNPETDNVEHYILYRQIGSAPNVNSTIVGQIPEPTSPSQDSVMYVDSSIQPRVHYYYAVQAVNTDQLSSTLSNPVSAAIPKILFPESIVLKSDTTYLMSLNSGTYVDDPDHDPAQLLWGLSGSNQINGSINPSNNNLTIVTPADTTVTTTFQFTVTDPDGFYDNVSMAITLTAGTPPFPPPPPPDDDTEKVVAYPVPFVASDPPPCECITFRIPASVESAKLLIYTIMGDLVFTESNLSSKYNWSVVNSSGNNISPGVYIYFVQDGSGKQIESGKIVIVR